MTLYLLFFYRRTALVGIFSVGHEVGAAGPKAKPFVDFTFYRGRGLADAGRTPAIETPLDMGPCAPYKLVNER
jgi:hypothetical protein